MPLIRGEISMSCIFSLSLRGPACHAMREKTRIFCFRVRTRSPLLYLDLYAIKNGLHKVWSMISVRHREVPTIPIDNQPQMIWHCSLTTSLYRTARHVYVVHFLCQFVSVWIHFMFYVVGDLSGQLYLYVRRRFPAVFVRI